MSRPANARRCAAAPANVRSREDDNHDRPYPPADRLCRPISRRTVRRFALGDEGTEGWQAGAPEDARGTCWRLRCAAIPVREHLDSGCRATTNRFDEMATRRDGLSLVLWWRAGSSPARFYLQERNGKVVGVRILVANIGWQRNVLREAACDRLNPGLEADPPPSRRQAPL
jgi:hypothetical protein